MIARRVALGALVGLAGCRLHFDDRETIDASDSTVVADLTGLVPFDPADFGDNGMIVDNPPTAVAALYAPFSLGFAVAIGRSIVEVQVDGSTIVHDFRPTTFDTEGPDAISSMVFAAPADVGPQLWLGLGSWGGGDGVARISPTWSYFRENGYNNVGGVAVDLAGEFDAIGASTLYFVAGNDGVLRRDAGIATAIYPSVNTAGNLTVTPGAIHFIENDAWSTLAPSTHAAQGVTDSFVLFAEGNDAIVYALRNEHDLVRFEQGAETVIASAPDLDTHWIAASVPRAPHPLAGRLVILESNRVTNRDRLVAIEP